MSGLPDHDGAQRKNLAAMPNATVKPYARNKRPPPKGEWCDSKTVATAPSLTNAPHLKSCPNRATVALSGGGMPWETFVCESCATRIIGSVHTRESAKEPRDG